MSDSSTSDSLGNTNSSQPDGPTHTFDLDDLRDEERTAIKTSREAVYQQAALPSLNLTGLSLSGGGIRSACFNLGLLEGLDRLPCDVAVAKHLKPPPGQDGRHDHLELFDYVSSVSGGSYAAGHLATAMLSSNKGMRTDTGEKFAEPEWLGNVPLTSKTVPGWLWGVGAWFLGVAFQLLKTGSLLLCLLAMLAYVMRSLDSRDAIRMCEVYGLDTDVERGFIPFWFALGIFLVGYWINALRQRKGLTILWFGAAASVIVAYVVLITLSLWSRDHLWFRERFLSFLFFRSFEGAPIDELSPLLFHIQYLFVLILPLIVTAVCSVLIVSQGFTWLKRRIVGALGLDDDGGTGGDDSRDHTDSWYTTAAVLLRRVLLSPLRRMALWLRRRINRDRAEQGQTDSWYTTAAVRLRSDLLVPLRRMDHWLRRRINRDRAEQDQTDSWVTTDPVRLRSFLLIPMLTALFCLAGLVTTGDIALTSTEDAAPRLHALQERSRELAETTSLIYRTALTLLGLTSLVFLFPRNLFKSARKVEDRAAGVAEAQSAALKRWALAPVFRVVVFLCSYGFILLVIFVLFSTVAGENVSGYYEWREDLPWAAFHQDDFKNPSLAWERIALDAARKPDSGNGPLIGPPKPSSPWSSLATRLMDVRKSDFSYDKDRVCGDELGRWEIGREFSLEHDRALDAEIRAWLSMPWIVRLFPRLAWLGPITPWTRTGFQLDPEVWRLYARNAQQFRAGERIASRIAGVVLSDPELYKDVPDAPPDAPPTEQESKQNPNLKEEYQARVASFTAYKARAKSLATLDSKKRAMRDAEPKPAIQAAIRNNNRLALQLYLPMYTQDRAKKVVFASIVWGEDQWTRLRIVLIAGAIWVLCCAVDVNSFSLQKFYRGHVIDSWVKTPPGKKAHRWLHETTNTYRGHEFGMKSTDPMERRAPLLLINATLEGNRSLGDEPDIRKHIFTFSRIASGSGSTGHWLNRGDGRTSLARRSHLDIGNIVATSGAFLSPGTIANPALSAILHLLNIQTGYWASNPETFKTRSPKECLLFHLAQSLGIDRDADSRFMLTDGAHVENLGLYVLLQRRCSLIVASDCSQEDNMELPRRRFDALVHVLQQAQVDGVEVSPFFNSRGYRHWLKTWEILNDGGDYGKDCLHKNPSGLDLLLPPDPPASPASSTTAGSTSSAEAKDKKPVPAGGGATAPAAAIVQEHYLFAQIVYPDGARGLLVYLRPTLTGDEGDSLLHGAAGSQFPDDDPVDQFYTPAKMNTYRLLGRHIATELMNDPVMVDAFARIAQGQAAGKIPERRVNAQGREGCATHCREIGLSCMGNRQRTFRPPVPSTPPPSEETVEAVMNPKDKRSRRAIRPG